jgi:uncharacterized protein YegP (UPF0339 family)
MNITHRIEDDYLPCEDYILTGVETKEGFVLFQNPRNNKYYFTLKNQQGSILLRSEGYPTSEVREVGIDSVIANLNQRKNYGIYERNGKITVILFAKNGQEIARSCEFDSREEVDKKFPEVKPPKPVVPIKTNDSPDNNIPDSGGIFVIKPKWFVWLLPLLGLGIFFIGKSCSETVIKEITNKEISTDSLKYFEENFSPIIVFFDNGKPSIKDSVVSFNEISKQYLQKENIFLSQNGKTPEAIRDLFVEIRYGKIALDNWIPKLNEIIIQKKIDTVQFLVSSFASPVGGEEKNKILTDRRLALVRNYILSKTKIEPKKLLVTEVSNGSQKAPIGIPSDIKNKSSVFSVAASKERRVEIAGIKLYSSNFKKGNTVFIKGDTVIIKGKKAVVK